MTTRNALNGMLITKNSIINIKNKKWGADVAPIDAESDLLAARVYTKAYLRHLIRSQEILGAQIAALNNLHFYLWLVREERMHILAGAVSEWKNKMTTQLRKTL